MWWECKECGGRGKLTGIMWEEKCTACHGTGLSGNVLCALAWLAMGVVFVIWGLLQ